VEQGTHTIKISVVIPAYNSAATIARAIDSVLTQSYSALEIIVVDDGSTDNTREIIASYGASVTGIYKSTNTGSSDTRNKGMDKATGYYIAFLDADDVWHKDKLRIVNNILIETSDINLLYHTYTLDSINEIRLPENIHLHKLSFAKLMLSNKIATPCAIIKNDPAFRFEGAMRYSEDYDLWLRIGYKHTMYFIEVPLTQLFRPISSAGGISASKTKMRKGEMYAYIRLAKLNPLFVFSVPFLLIYSMAKHLVKKMKR